MLLFALSVVAIKIIGGEPLVRLANILGQVVLSILIIIPAWFWLQFIARSLKVVCPQCGEREMCFTGQFPLARDFRCEACGAEWHRT